MDLTAAITTIAEKGWRVGLSFALCAMAVLLAHRYSVPEADVLKPYLGVATVAGLLGAAITLVAIASALASRATTRIKAMRGASQEQRNKKRKIAEIRREMFARLEILEPFQKSRLIELLETHRGPMFVMADGDGPTSSLIGTGMLISGERAHGGCVMHFNPLLDYERAEVIENLKSTVRR